MLSQKVFSQQAARLYNKIGLRHEKLRAEDKKIDQEITRLFKFLPKNLRGKTVLDAGCGSGIFSQALLKRGAERVICLDISEAMLNLARRRKRKFKLEGLHIVRDDLTRTKFKSKSFDIILAIFSLPYIIDLENIFKEFRRILKDKGLVFIASNYFRIKRESLLHTKVKYILGDIKLIGIIHTIEEYLDTAESNRFLIKDFFTNKEPHGLKINPSYKDKNLVKIHSFSAVLTKGL